MEIHYVQQKGKLPGDEEYPALWDILFGEIVKVINCISALVSRKVSSKVIISFVWFSKLLHDNLLLFDLENYETV